MSTADQDFRDQHEGAPAMKLGEAVHEVQARPRQMEEELRAALDAPGMASWLGLLEITRRMREGMDAQRLEAATNRERAEAAERDARACAQERDQARKGMSMAQEIIRRATEARAAHRAALGLGEEDGTLLNAIQDLKVDRDEARHMLEEARKERDAARDERDQARLEIVRLQAEISALTCRVEVLGQEKDDLNQRLFDLDDQLEDVRAIRRVKRLWAKHDLEGTYGDLVDAVLGETA